MRSPSLDLNRACRSGDTPAVQRILQLPRTNVNEVSEDGFTPLMYACEGGHLQIVSLLLSRRDIQVNAQSEIDHKTALMLAVIRNHPRVVSALLRHPDIDPNIVDINGMTALMFAIMKDYPQMTRLLLQHPKIDPNRADRGGKTPLRLAREGNKLSSLRLLLTHPATRFGTKNDLIAMVSHLAFTQKDPKLGRTITIMRREKSPSSPLQSKSTHVSPTNSWTHLTDIIVAFYDALRIITETRDPFQIWEYFENTKKLRFFRPESAPFIQFEFNDDHFRRASELIVGLFKRLRDERLIVLKKDTLPPEQEELSAVSSRIFFFSNRMSIRIMRSGETIPEESSGGATCIIRPPPPEKWRSLSIDHMKAIYPDIYHIGIILDACLGYKSSIDILWKKFTPFVYDHLPKFMSSAPSKRARTRSLRETETMITQARRNQLRTAYYFDIFRRHMFGLTDSPMVGLCGEISVDIVNKRAMITNVSFDQVDKYASQKPNLVWIVSVGVAGNPERHVNAIIYQKSTQLWYYIEPHGVFPDHIPHFINLRFNPCWNVIRSHTPAYTPSASPPKPEIVLLHSTTKTDSLSVTMFRNLQPRVDSPSASGYCVTITMLVILLFSGNHFLIHNVEDFRRMIDIWILISDCTETLVPTVYELNHRIISRLKENIGTRKTPTVG